MFENQTPPATPSPSFPASNPSFGTPPPPAPPLSPAQPKVFTMPEKFRAADGGGSAGGGRSTKRLVTILIVVLVLAGLALGGLYLFQNVFNQPANDNVILVTNRTNTNANLNSNTNTNANVNAETNSNTNATVNSNTNDNTNTAVNSNANTNTSVEPLPSSTDTDGDGLTDTEEVVYTTDAAKPDTDGDGFIDGKQVRADGTIIGELYNGYNPAGVGRLEDSALVKRQANSKNEYSLLLPTSWTAVVDSNGGILINPSQATTEFFQSRIYDNTNGQTPKEWYHSISPSADVDSLRQTTVNGLEGIYSEDGSTIYLFKGTKVYGLSYNTGSVSQANYYTTFDMMIQSFRLVSS